MFAGVHIICNTDLLFVLITAPKRNCEKVMFSQVCVCLSTRGPHVTITHDALDPTVQSPGPGPSLPPLGISSGTSLDIKPGTPPQTSDLGPPPWTSDLGLPSSPGPSPLPLQDKRSENPGHET